jgi:hypothetical protein
MRSAAPLALLLAACGQASTIDLPGPGADDAGLQTSDAAVQDGALDVDAAEHDAAEHDAGTSDAGAGADVGPTELPRFSFFVTSLEAMRELSGREEGFGGDLRFGEPTGLEGADKLCATIAAREVPWASQKTWRAFLSASTGGPGGGPVHAIDRIGAGPWYDRNGRLVASDLAGLAATRPAGDPALAADLPNERGESQRNQPGPGATGTADNHDVLTGSNASGRFQGGGAANTCDDWTSVTAAGRPNGGHSWPAMSGRGWILAHPLAGCAAVVNLLQNGPGARDCRGVGCGGGYGALYCFALTP